MSKRILASFCLLISMSSFGQESMLGFVGDYFRVDPFEAKFSTFTKVLSNDKQLMDKTETLDEYSNHSISGVYKVFNPFSLNASKVEMHFKSIGSRKYFDVSTPMYIYEMTARFPDNQEARKKIKKDYWHMVNRFRRLYSTNVFTGIEQKPLQRKNMNDNGDNFILFFANYKDQASCRLSWTILPSSNEIEVNIGVCLAVINDRTYPLGHYPGRAKDEYYDLITWKKDVK